MDQLFIQIIDTFSYEIYTDICKNICVFAMDYYFWTICKTEYPKHELNLFMDKICTILFGLRAQLWVIDFICSYFLDLRKYSHPKVYILLFHTNENKSVLNIILNQIMLVIILFQYQIILQSFHYNSFLQFKKWN